LPSLVALEVFRQGAFLIAHVTYRAAVTISAILTWLRHMGDTP
jgi:hypothetical protein